MFSFGKNWLNFLKKAKKESFYEAKLSVEKIINKVNIYNGSFLDVGCGSGIFSLAAKQLSFKVTSFDYDNNSVLATKSLKSKFFANDKNWVISQGSILDNSFVNNFKSKFDIVYSWGVLHHTGNMIEAFNNISELVKREGCLVISIYNDQGIFSSYWKVVKKLYNINIIFKFIIIVIHFPYFMLLRPLKKILINKKLIDNRGMIFWYDYIDWLGGYPFEVATKEKVISFFESKGYNLISVIDTRGRLGCNEYIFRRTKI